MKHFTLSLAALLFAYACAAQPVADAASYLRMASETIDSIYKYYSVEDTKLLRENYPFDTGYSASYLSQEAAAANSGKKPFAFLWPYSGTLSMTAAMLEATDCNKEYKTLLTKTVMPGLDLYYDTNRKPAAYSSYVVSDDPKAGRFYDDNDWIALDFVDLYKITGENKYLRDAEIIWKYIESGTAETGGVYWSEGGKSRNTCSSAPAAVLALKLLRATGNGKYLKAAEELYSWTKLTLQDKDDYLYFDNISSQGRVDRRKFSYNSGQMLQAAVLLYEATGETDYMTDAKNIAEAAYTAFFTEFQPVGGGEPFRVLRGGNTWFHCIMFRGFAELYRVDGTDKKYIEAFGKNLTYIWEHGRSAEGLFVQDFSGRRQDNRKWLLAQAAMVEMFARMSMLVEN